jgi:hypothetical protein
MRPGGGGQPSGKALKEDPYTALNFMHPLAAAAAGGHLEVCKVLLTAGVGAVTAVSALCKAAKGGHLEVVKLIEGQAGPGSKEHILILLGLSPLEWAAEGGHVPTLSYLLEKALQECKQPRGYRTIIHDVVTSCKGSLMSSWAETNLSGMWVTG